MTSHPTEAHLPAQETPHWLQTTPQTTGGELRTHSGGSASQFVMDAGVSTTTPGVWQPWRSEASKVWVNTAQFLSFWKGSALCLARRGRFACSEHSKCSRLNWANKVISQLWKVIQINEKYIYKSQILACFPTEGKQELFLHYSHQASTQPQGCCVPILPLPWFSPVSKGANLGQMGKKTTPKHQDYELIWELSLVSWYKPAQTHL